MLLKKYLGMLLPDELYLKYRYWRAFGKKLNLKDPITFNEKLQWLKLNDHNPLYTTLVDKYAVRNYIKKKIGEEYLIPLVGGPWKSVDDIPFESLPDQFVLKATHDSGSVMICRNKYKFDIEAAKEKLKKSLKNNFYYSGREWPYKNVPPQIIAEKYMEEKGSATENNDVVNVPTNTGKALIDYKFFCFNGFAESVMVCSERETGNPKFYFFDKNWDLKRYNKRGKEAPDDFAFPKPECIDKMFSIAEKLSKGMPFVRVDLYCIEGVIYFGEMTFYPDSGFDANLLPETDELWGNALILPEKRE